MEDATVDALLRRMMLATETKRESNLAQILGVTPQALYSAKKKESIPPAWVMDIATRWGVSLDWLYFGQGTMKREGTTESAASEDTQRMIDELKSKIENLESMLRDSQAEALRAYRLAVDAMRPETELPQKIIPQSGQDESLQNELQKDGERHERRQQERRQG